MRSLLQLALEISALVERRMWPLISGLIGTSVIVSLLDAVGLGVVFVLLKAVLDPTGLEGGALSWLKKILPVDSNNEFLVLMCWLLFAVFALKTALQLLNSWLRSTVEWRVREALSTELLDGYLRSPYLFLLRRSTSEVMTNTVNGVGLVAASAVGLADMVGDVFLLLALNATLFYLQPWLTLTAVALFSVFGVAYFAVVQPRLARWGKQSSVAGNKLWDCVSDPLAGIKQVRTLALEDFFTQAFKVQVRVVGRLALRRNFIAQGLKPLLELFIVGGLLGILAYLLLAGGAVAEFAPLLALFAGAAYRLLPGMVRISTTLQSLQFAKASVDLVRHDVARFRSEAGQLVDARRVPHPGLKDEIRLEGVSFGYEGSTRPAFKDVSITVRRGESIGIVGPSGAGKTSLIDVLLGLLPPTEGTVSIDGRLLKANDTPARLFAYVPQECFLINDTVRRNIALGTSASRVDEARLNAALQAASLTELVSELPAGLDTVIGERGIRLSGGQRQRLAIARALYYDSDVLVFDESTSSLDALTEVSVTEAIERLRHKKTLLVITHRLSTVRNYDRLIFLGQDQAVSEGTFDELYATNASFRAMVREMELESPDEPMPVRARR